MQAAMESPRMLKVMAAEGAKTTRRHFADRGREKHRGGPHNYWAQAARGTTYEVRGKEAFIVIDHVGVALHYYGGTVRPKNAKALTIPVEGSEAEGKRASEFDDLFAVKADGSGNYRGFLARQVAADQIEPLFWLRKSATIREDKSVIPTDEALIDSMTTALNRELDRL